MGGGLSSSWLSIHVLQVRESFFYLLFLGILGHGARDKPSRILPVNCLDTQRPDK